MSRWAHLLVASVLLACGLAACVTETTTRTLPPDGGRRTDRAAAAAAGGPLSPHSKPIDPDAFFESRVVVGVRPLAEIQYDGQILPLVSPDGRHLAVQRGGAPSWETILALPGATPPGATSIGVYAIDEGRMIERPDGPDARAVILGRSATDNAYLIERPGPDGARDIGLARWNDGSVRWLVADGAVNAHAVLSPEGDLAFVRSPREGGRGAVVDAGRLVLQTTTNRIEADPPAGAGYAFPTFSGDGKRLFAFLVSEQGTELVCLAIRHDRLDVTSAVRFGGGATRGGRGGSALLTAYQAVAAIQTPLHTDDPGLTVYHPARRRMVRVSPTGQMIAWAPGSFGYAPANTDTSGEDNRLWVEGIIATATELLYVRAPRSRDSEVARVSLIAGAHVPRLTSKGTGGTYLLLGTPDHGESFVLSVTELRLGSDEPTGQPDP